MKINEKLERVWTYFCSNHRKLYRKARRFFCIATFVLSLITAGLLLYRDVLNRRMLNARAKNQITLIKTGVRRCAFTFKEWSEIANGWQASEYDKVEPVPEPVCFTETKSE